MTKVEAISMISNMITRETISALYDRYSRELQLEEEIFMSERKGFEDDLEAKELFDAVNGILDNLDNNTRQIFYLKRESGMTYQEIAGVSERTVKRRVKSALVHLARALEKKGFSMLLLFCCYYFGSISFYKWVDAR